MGKYTACICEGEVLRCRSGKEFQERYLRKGFTEKITVYRILDSRRENFNIGKAYKPKIDVKNIITAPEIEMLIICNEDKYEEYQNEKRKNPDLKPSTYCKSILKYENVKCYDFVLRYFSDIDVLIKALHEYRRISKLPKNEMCILDLLK